MLQMEWSQPQVQGDIVTPRAGHAGITIDEDWYMVGGGDNRSGMYIEFFKPGLFTSLFSVDAL